METEHPTPSGRSRAVLAAAIALVLSSPINPAAAESTTSPYDSAVSYADYRDQKGTYKVRASDLIGRDVRNASNDTIGEIDDLVVSRDGDQVMAILSLGGFFDLGSKLVAIPYEDLRVARDGEHVYYNATQDELQARREFTYADGEQPVKAQSTDRKPAAAGARGDASRSTVGESRSVTGRSADREDKAADNSAHNAPNVAGANLTPFDQSHAKADVAITRSIRRTLVKEAAGINRVQDELAVIRR